MLTLFAYKKLNWSICRGLLCVVCEAVNIWIGVTWGQEGLLEGFSLGRWKRLRSV
jgi:hypothetical protein